VLDIAKNVCEPNPFGGEAERRVRGGGVHLRAAARQHRVQPNPLTLAKSCKQLCHLPIRDRATTASSGAVRVTGS
jgi:hypothetical protein